MADPTQNRNLVVFNLLPTAPAIPTLAACQIGVDLVHVKVGMAGAVGNRLNKMCISDRNRSECAPTYSTGR